MSPCFDILSQCISESNKVTEQTGRKQKSQDSSLNSSDSRYSDCGNRSRSSSSSSSSSSSGSSDSSGSDSDENSSSGPSSSLPKPSPANPVAAVAIAARSFQHQCWVCKGEFASEADCREHINLKHPDDSVFYGGDSDELVF